MKKLIFTFLVVIIISGCSSQGKSTKSDFSVAGSIWEYSDKDWTYEITFLENGMITSTHPNDDTPENDTWNQANHHIHFEFNDGYAKYDGELQSQNLIIGIAESAAGKWKWEMKRIDP